MFLTVYCGAGELLIPPQLHPCFWPFSNYINRKTRARTNTRTWINNLHASMQRQKCIENNRIISRVLRKELVCLHLCESSYCSCLIERPCCHASRGVAGACWPTLPVALLWQQCSSASIKARQIHIFLRSLRGTHVSVLSGYFNNNNNTFSCHNKSHNGENVQKQFAVNGWI